MFFDKDGVLRGVVDELFDAAAIDDVVAGKQDEGFVDPGLGPQEGVAGAQLFVLDDVGDVDLVVVLEVPPG